MKSFTGLSISTKMPDWSQMTVRTEAIQAFATLLWCIEGCEESRSGHSPFVNWRELWMPLHTKTRLSQNAHMYARVVVSWQFERCTAFSTISQWCMGLWDLLMQTVMRNGKNAHLHKRFVTSKFQKKLLPNYGVHLHLSNDHCLKSCALWRSIASR